MNNLGYSKDNVFIGDVRVKGEDETVIIGNENGGLGYILPEEKGNAGDVITMDPTGNTTSFQPVSLPTASGRVIQNFFQMTAPQTSYGIGVFQPLYLNSNGSDVIDRDDLAIGSTVRLRTKGYFYNGDTPSGTPVTGQFSVKIEVPNSSGGFDFYTTEVTIEDIAMGTEVFTGRGWFEIHVDVTKVNSSNDASISVSGIFNAFDTSTTFTTRDLVFYESPTSFANRLPNTDNSNRVTPAPYFSSLPSTFALQVRWAATTGSARAVATEYTIDLLNTNTDILATTISPATDHNTLANLNVGDPHQLYAYLGGRTGGQILSGGITPVHFLTLKSHVSGLDNMIIRDLNTEFKKNIDMDQNQIDNVLVVNNQAGPLNLIGGSGVSAVLIDPTPTQGIIVGSNVGTTIEVTADGDMDLRSNTSNINLTPNTQMSVNVGGLPRLVVDASEVGAGATLNMNNNNITNGDQITCNTINPVGTITTLTSDAIQINTGSAFNRINSDGTLILSGGGLGASDHIQLTGSSVVVDQPLNVFQPSDFKNNNLSNVNQVSSSGTLTLLGALGNRCDIGVAGATRLEVEDSRVFISQFADLNIHGQVIWVAPNTMPTLFNADTTYIFVGSRNTSTSFVLPANVKISGTGKIDSKINFNGGGTLFTSTDENLTVSDITLTSSNNTGKLFDLTNAAQDKTINMTGVQMRNAKNGMDITGYDLVDMNNCLFTYFESGSPTPVGVRITNCSKLELTSCEFLRWFQEGGVPASTFFNGSMLDLTGTLNALNLTSCFFHPQYDQNGIDTALVSSVIEGTISSNTFIDINLNTGGGFQVLNLNPTIAPSYVVEGNSIYPNLRAQLTYVFSGVNATNTVLSGGSNPNAVNTGGLAIALTSQFSSLTAAGLATYLKKRSANFLITASANLKVIAGGANQRVGLGLRVNGIDIPNAYSFVSLDSAGNDPIQSVLNFTGVASQNDTFELTIFNASGNNDVLVSDVNFAGIEI